jgi:hypothetical protein
MTLTPSLRHSVEPFEDDVLRIVSALPFDGFVTNNVLLPNVNFRCYPDEHDALLLLPWAGYTLDAKNWHGDFRFPGNNPVEWKRRKPEEKRGRDWRLMAGHPNPFHIGKQKASILFSYCRQLRIGLDDYPVHPLIVLPNDASFTPDRHDYDPADGSGPRLYIRILTLNRLESCLRQDRKDARKTYDLKLLRELLGRLEAEPTDSDRGLGLCGFSLDQRRTDRPELGCPVECAVYEATHDFTETPAEVRLYRRWPRNEETDRFLRHASRRAAALFRCRVPGVIRLFNAEEMPDQLLLAFEHFEGETIRERISGLGPLEAGVVRALVAHLARTVQALHEEGVVHHDIRPEYVMVAPNLESHGGANHRLVGLTNPLIDDAGLTTTVFQNNFDASFSSVEMRTHRHPARGRCETDVFSLGRLGIYCLLGETKYREVVAGQSDEPLTFDLSAADPILRRVLARAAEYRAENRFSSARDMAAELEK